MKTTMKFITASDYYQALLENIPKAKQRVVIHSMTLLWGPRTEVLMPMLQGALSRGVEVRILGDYYSKFYANMPRINRSEASPKWAHTRALNYQLEGADAHVTYLGKLGLNPFKGRCHSKITIIDDLAYTFGGVNFTDSSFDNHDYMFEIRDKKIADRLYALILEITKNKPFDDIEEKLDDHNTLLFDGGKPGSSIIYGTACKVVSEAKRVYFVSQMCPSGKLAKLITETENYCYFIRPAQADAPSNMALIFDKARYHIKNHYKGKTYIHAKFILCEGKDGSKHIISGSNNFSWRGIAFGTKEIAVHSTDPQQWQVMYDYMQGTIV